MTKWAGFQIAAVGFFCLFIVGKQLYLQDITSYLSLVNIGIKQSIILTFLSIIIVVWVSALILFWQSKKGKPLFEHRIWRIMPAIFGVWLLFSIIGFLFLGMTYLSDINSQMHWLLDLFLTYFLAFFYLLILSILIRYGNLDTDLRKITTSAHVAVIIAFIIVFFLPGL